MNPNLLADMQQAQLLMVAGFIMLGWVLARRQIKMRKRVNRETKTAKKALKTMREHKEPAVPLSDAPPETQRWQVAMFDLQRELMAELDTRISVVQTLMRQLDERIARVSQLEASGKANSTTPRRRFTPQQRHLIGELSRSGHTTEQIAGQVGLSVEDVETIADTI